MVAREEFSSVYETLPWGMNLHFPKIPPEASPEKGFQPTGHRPYSETLTLEEIRPLRRDF